MLARSRVPFRCRVCRKRFYRFDAKLAQQRARESEGDIEPVAEPAPAVDVAGRRGRRRIRVVVRVRLPRILVAAKQALWQS
jgi:hypothetical protein